MKFHTIWPSHLLTYMQPYLSLKKWQHNFPKMRGGGQRPFGIFPKNHPIWRSHPSLTNMQDRRNIAEKHLGGQIPSHRALSSPWYFVSQIICLANSLESNYTTDLERNCRSETIPCLYLCKPHCYVSSEDVFQDGGQPDCRQSVSPFSEMWQTLGLVVRITPHLVVFHYCLCLWRRRGGG